MCFFYAILKLNVQILQFNLKTLITKEPSMSNLTSPVAYANPAEPTNNDVYVYVTFDENAFVNQYSFDGRTWEEYVPGMNGISFNENGVVYFRSLDADGSVSPTTTYEVTNIDKVAPDAPAITVESADTFGGVLITAEFSKDSVAFFIRISIERFLTFLNFIKRRHCKINITVFYKLRHIAEEER